MTVDPELYVVHTVPVFFIEPARAVRTEVVRTFPAASATASLRLEQDFPCFLKAKKSHVTVAAAAPEGAL